MNTIYLSSNKGKSFYLTSITKEQKEKLYQIKNSKDLDIEKEFTNLSLLWEINCNGILKIGKTAEASGSSISEYVLSFEGKDTEPVGKVGNNREIHYRDYSVTYEQQRESMHLIIKCSDATSSGRSAIRQMKDKFIILWEVPNTDKIHINLQELLKGQKWYKKII